MHPDELSRLAEAAFQEAAAHLTAGHPDRALDRFQFSAARYGQLLQTLAALGLPPTAGLYRRLGECGMGLAECLRQFGDAGWRGPLAEANGYLQQALLLAPADPHVHHAHRQLAALAAVPDPTPALVPTPAGGRQPFSRPRARVLVHAASAAYTPGGIGVPLRDPELGHLGTVFETPTEVVVAYRGSIVPRRTHTATELLASLNDWFGVNFNLGQVSALGGRVSRGWLDRLDRSWDQVWAVVGGGRLNGRRLWVTGHSMGGAVSILSGQRFAELGVVPDGVYAFGAPKVGDEAFVAHYRPPLFCVEHRYDIVPWLPLSRWVNDLIPAGQVKATLAGYFSTNDYLKAGEEWWITPGGDLRQPTWRDRLFGYRLASQVLHPEKFVSDHWIEEYIEYLNRPPVPRPS